MNLLWKRHFLLTLFISLISLLLMVSVPWGTRAMIGLANIWVPNLNIEYQSGVWWQDIQLKEVKYANETVNINGKDILINLGMRCLWRAALCVERLSADTLVLDVAREASPKPSEAPTALAFPIDISVLTLKIKQFSLTQATDPIFALSNTEVIGLQAFNQANTNVDGGISTPAKVNIELLNINSIALPSSKQTTNNKEPIDWEQISTWRFPSITSLDITLPLSVNIASANISQIAQQSNAPNIQTMQVEKIQLLTDVLSIDKLLFNYQQTIVESNLAIHNSTMEANVIINNLQYLTSFSQIDQLRIVAQGSLSALSMEIIGYEGQTPRANVILHTDLTQSELPSQLTGTWNNLQLHPFTSSLMDTSGDITLIGDLNRWQTQAKIGLTHADKPDLLLQLRTEGNLSEQSLTLEHKPWQGIHTQLSGQLSNKERLFWRGKLLIHELDTQDWYPSVSAQLSGSLNHSFQWNGEKWEIDLLQSSLTGKWLSHELLVNTSAHLNSDMEINIARLEANVGRNQLTFIGNIDAQQSITGQSLLNAEALQQLHPDLSGALNGAFVWSGSIAQPDVTGQLSAENILWQDLVISSVTTGIDIDWSTSLIDLSINAGNSRFQGYELSNININAQGAFDDHQLTLEAKGKDLHIVSEITGILSEGQWHGSWLKAHIDNPIWPAVLVGADGRNVTESNLSSNAPPNIKVNWLQQSASITPHCWLNQEASLCLQQLQWQAHELAYDIVAKSLSVSSFLPYVLPATRIPSTSSKMHLEMKGKWLGKGLPLGELTAELAPLEWQWPSQEAAFHINQIQLEANSNQQGLTASLSLLSKQLGNADATLSLNGDPSQREIKNSWQFRQLQLSPWAPFIPSLDELSGNLNGQLHLQSTSGKWLSDGQIRLDNGQVLLNQYETEITDIEQTLVLDGQRAELIGAFRMGEGLGKLKGDIDWQSTLASRFSVSGDGLAFKNNHSRITGTFSPNLSASLVENNLSLEGEVLVTEALVKLQQLPENAVSPSSDTIINGDVPKEEKDNLKIKANIDLSVDPDNSGTVNIDAFGLTSSLRGSLSINVAQQQVQAVGDLSLVDGFYKAFGQQLQLRQGDILFSGPLTQPSLQIAAVRDPQATEDNVIAGINVSGLATQPRVEVFSEPDLPQSEALSYLLRGKSLGSASTGTQEEAALNLLLSYGLSKGENIVTHAGDKLGVKDLGITTQGQGDQTKVAISGSLSDKIKVGYGVGVFDASTEINVRYDLSKHLYLQAVSGIESALDIYYQLFF